MTGAPATVRGGRRPTAIRGARIADPTAGSASAELVVLAPLLVAFAVVLLLAGRLVETSQQVGDAARTAAESAVIAGTPADATALSALTAFADLASAHVRCHPYAVVTDTSHFAAGGLVAVNVSCGIPLGALGVPGVPQSAEVTSRSTAVIEPYREVG
jgi:Flp pilus assembly protein TadG